MSRFSVLKKDILQNNACPKMESDDKAVHISINDASEIISPYAEDNKAVINTEFALFLENSVKDVPVKQDLILQISGKNLALEPISSAIKNYYYNEFVDTQRKLKHNLRFSIITLIIGLLALSCTIIINAFDIPFLIGGAIDIFAWVFVWESLDLFFFRRAELKYQQYRYMNFINAKIDIK